MSAPTGRLSSGTNAGMQLLLHGKLSVALWLSMSVWQPCIQCAHQVCSLPPVQGLITTLAIGVHNVPEGLAKATVLVSAGWGHMYAGVWRRCHSVHGSCSRRGCQPGILRAAPSE